MSRCWIAFIVAICSHLICVGAAFADEAAKAPAELAPGLRTMRIVVRDEAGEPLAGAAIHVSIWPSIPMPGFLKNRDYACDEKGETRIEIPEKFDILRIWSRRPGYAPLFAQWWPEHDPTALPIPKEFQFKMTAGVEIGGDVVDESGAPIRDVQIEVRHLNAEVVTKASLLFGSSRRRIPARPTYCIWLATGADGSHPAQKSDAEGFWSIDNVPPGDDVKVSLLLSHPDYISDENWGGMQAAQSIGFGALREKSARIVMTKGVRLTGKVTDPSGEPVPGAVVIWGDDPYSEWGGQEGKTKGDSHLFTCFYLVSSFLS